MRYLDRRIGSSRLATATVSGFIAVLVAGVFTGLAHGQQSTPLMEAPSPQSSAQEQDSGSVNGTVADPSGAFIAGAQVKLLRGQGSPAQISITDGDGHFAFPHCPPGFFAILVTAPGFAPQTVSGTLSAGEVLSVPPVTLAIAAASEEIQVHFTSVEIAQEEIREEEKQRLFGVVPNFNVSYTPDAQPLVPKQKFELAWKFVVDPVTLAINGGIAAAQQGGDQFNGYGQGAEGYGKRYAASYADLVSGELITTAILPSLLKQDPRYFYKGTGTKGSRILYAIANVAVCKGDNRRWQANYSNLAGTMAAAGISNFYYPPSDRTGVQLTFENFGTGLAGAAAANLAAEFLVRKPLQHKQKSKSGS
jgi:hypothetical protein